MKTINHCKIFSNIFKCLNYLKNTLHENDFWTKSMVLYYLKIRSFCKKKCVEISGSAWRYLIFPFLITSVIGWINRKLGHFGESWKNLPFLWNYSFRVKISNFWKICLDKFSKTEEFFINRAESCPKICQKWLVLVTKFEFLRIFDDKMVNIGDKNGD